MECWSLLKDIAAIFNKINKKKYIENDTQIRYRDDY